MCYKLMETDMERVQVLSKLRTEDKIFPDDFDHVQLENQCKIIRWLLNHDPSQRPTAQELLQSKYLPPPKMEEAELNDILRSTISDPHSKPYRRMINALFSQSISLADDHLYDSDIYKGTFSIKTNLANRKVLERLEQIFQRHGALKVNTSILMPKPAFYKNTEQYVCMMDDSGQLLGLPHDLRVPFARYVARNNIYQLKRYCIERVFKKTNSGFYPSELTECAFDIITRTRKGLIPDGEVLALVGEVINDFLPLQKRHYYVRINHTSLLKAVLQHVGVNEDEHLAVLGSLPNLMNLMSECSLNDPNVTDLQNLLETEVSLSKVSSVLKCITRTNSQAGRLVMHALNQIKTVISNARNFGLKLPVMVSVGLVDNIQQYSGVYYQVAVHEEENNTGRTFPDIFAIGGRYDSLISEFYSPVFSGIPVKTHCGVGVSFAFEQIFSAMLKEDLPTSILCDILVCTIGCTSLRKVGMKLLKALWNADFRADLYWKYSKDLEKIFDFCRTHGISYLVLLKESEAVTIAKQAVHKVKAVISKAESLGLELQAVTLNKQALHDIETMISKAKSLGPKLQAVNWLANQARLAKETLISNTELLELKLQAVTIAKQALHDIETVISKAKSLWFELQAVTLAKQALHEKETVISNIEYLRLYSKAVTLAKQALHDIETVISKVESLGLQFQLIVKTIEKERVTEKLTRQNEMDQTLEKSLVDFCKQNLISNKLDSLETSQTGVSRGSPATATQPHVDYAPSISPSSSGGNLTINFYFFMHEGKISAGLRKKSEAQIESKIKSSLPWRSGNDIIVEVIAVEMTVEDIRIIAAFLDLDGDEDSFKSSVNAIAEKLPRYTMYLSQIADRIYKLKFEKRSNYIVLYSMKDDRVKLLTST